MCPFEVRLLSTECPLERTGQTVGGAFVATSKEIGGEFGGDLDSIVRAVCVILRSNLCQWYLKVQRTCFA